MSSTEYDIDNDDNLFIFEPYDMLPSRFTAQRARPEPGFATGVGTQPAPNAPHDAPSTSEGQGETPPSSPRDKGKQAAIPMPIRPATSIHDIFDVSPPNLMLPIPSSFASSAFSSFTSSSYTLSSPGSSRGPGSYEPFSSPTLSEVLALGFQDAPSPLITDPSGKGKGREQPPTLPPLILGSPALGDDDIWMNFDSSDFSGPSSLNSPSSYNATTETRVEPPLSVQVLSSSPTAMAELPTNIDADNLVVPTRSRSLSSLSIDSSTSVTTVNTKSKTRTFARKLLFGKKTPEDDATRPPTPGGISAAMSSQALTTIHIPGVVPSAAGNVHMRQWYAAPKTIDTGAFVSRPPPPIPVLSLETAITYPKPRGALKHKGRSHSSPLPFSALDIVPVASTDIFEPLPLIVKNYFDDILPRELRLRILQALVQVHIDAHERMVNSTRWSVNRASASRNQWVGKDRGVRELFKLSRVSKSWRSLVFDGQLWIEFDLSSFPGIPRQVLQRITESAGPFIQKLNVSGLSHLDSEKLLDVASNLCLMSPSESLSYTQLTSINLQGCTGLTTRSLHHLLIRSRSLKKLVARGLTAVTNTTCEILATYCPDLTTLNMSRCANMDAEGIEYLATAALERGEHLQLRELRVCGLKHTTDEMMGALGRAAPFLEVLDLSYARRLHNSALEAFVACGSSYVHESEARYDEGLGVDTVCVSARELGREVGSNDAPYLRRRVTNLRHLNLSFCMLLTDQACVNLSFSVPKLEFLEMAGIGAELKDAGLEVLFDRTPLIRRVDLADAVEVGNGVLAALTPPPESQPDGDSGEAEPRTGQALEYLNVSSSLNVTDHGLLTLIRRCKKLRTLNAKIVAVDCRDITEPLVKELAPSTRPRLGWRAYAARRLYYLDGRDGNEDDLKIGQDECDEGRVVVKTFHSWQTVDAVKASREKRKARAAAEGVASGGKRSREGSDWDEGFGGSKGRGGRMRWWSPGGRRGSSSGRASPLALAEMNDGCRTM